jgi:hypothetical protein
MKRILLLLQLALIGLAGHAATYYVSPSGNDSNNGTSQAQAWRTVARAQQVAGNLQPGDQILFQRGGTYTGKLTVNANGSSGNPIIIGAYGTGAAPVISGSVPVTGWTQWQGNIWRASIAQPVRHVWSNGSLMTLARFPNTGYLTSTSGNHTQMSSNGITQSSGFWNGGEIVRRTTNWSYERATISNQSNGTVTHAAIAYSFDNGSGWGFYLRNKLAALDAPGEWFYDAAAGHLYFWAPGNGDPNSMDMQASVLDHGVEVGYQRQHIRVEGLAFRGQHLSGVHNMYGNHTRVTGCTFDFVNTAIKSVGSNSIYSGNTVTNTFGSGMSLIETNSTVEGNVFTNIAVFPGLGENAWGYYGLYMLGNGNIVRANTLTNTGNSAIFLEGNTTVEKNIITNAVSILNDGGGIYFDIASGSIIQDNIITDLIGDVTSARDPLKICHGIFFGMDVIQNTIVRRNTISNCLGAGILVDHTMSSSGNQIRDNVLFNNRTQLVLTDFSNFNSPGASPPYYHPAYNDVYTGNIMYSMHPDQLCMQQYTMNNGPAPVDFGTFTNNRYFNPFNELAIRVSQVGTTHVDYSLERWQQVQGKDAGSTRSPHRQELYEVTEQLSANLVPNGNFDNNVNGWFGWPSQGQVSHDNTMLDNGSLRVNFSNGGTSPEFYLRHNATSANVQSGQWYELRYTTQSNMHGNLRVEFKAQSQASSPNHMAMRTVPFDSQRRDMRMIFQSTLTEPGQTFFTNHFTQSTYWLDNVQLYRVSVAPVDPHTNHIMLVNEQSTSQSFMLQGCWRDVSGGLHSDEITIPAYGSVVLAREPETLCGLTTGVEDAMADAPADRIYPNPVRAGDVLRIEPPAESTIQLDLIDAGGRAVLRHLLPPGGSTLPIASNVPAGLYVVRMEQDGNVRHQRLVVQ